MIGSLFITVLRFAVVTDVVAIPLPDGIPLTNSSSPKDLDMVVGLVPFNHYCVPRGTDARPAETSDPAAPTDGFIALPPRNLQPRNTEELVAHPLSGVWPRVSGALVDIPEHALTCDTYFYIQVPSSAGRFLEAHVADRYQTHRITSVSSLYRADLEKHIDILFAHAFDFVCLSKIVFLVHENGVFAVRFEGEDPGKCTGTHTGNAATSPGGYKTRDGLLVHPAQAENFSAVENESRNSAPTFTAVGGGCSLNKRSSNHLSSSLLLILGMIFTSIFLRHRRRL